MELLLICLVAFLASGLTLFSGFGLGTLLLPVFSLFFPVDIAVAMTAIVHFLNNVFKILLFKKYINRKLVFRFGIPSVIAAVAGAILLNQLGKGSPITTYSIGNSIFHITILKIVIGVLMIIFALFELIPALKKLSIDTKYLPAGGLLSGFFGGLSGHQGALRSAFLLRLQLSKEQFIATGIAIACMIDISRLSVYAVNIK
ncbi:MAG TPA: sulfite exporter TauE/SafE family protein, partial [Chitinophagaceae bacterium]|nr:sulfite exporter TauE/SafE family protein [Chitinophagaceae bacterium]